MISLDNGLIPPIGTLSEAFTPGQNLVNLKLTKTINGMELDQCVYILDICSDRVVAQATNLKMCASLEGTVYLHSPAFIMPVAAHLEAIDVRQGIFVLSHIAYLKDVWKFRSNERVHPKKPTYVSILIKRKYFRAYLASISRNGARLYVNKVIQTTNVQPGSKILLDFELSPDCRWQSLRGTVVYIREMDKVSEKLGIQLFPIARETHSLERYIADRKREILEELQQAYIKACEPQGAERLYF
jgi:hypothetical protein